MISLHPRRSLRWTLRLLLLLAALAGAALFVAPRLVDTAAVRTKLERQVSEAAGGKLAWDSLEVRLLPAPRGVLKGVRIEIPDVLSGRVEEVEARLRLWALFAGRAEVAAVRAVRPALRVTVARSARAESSASVDPLTAYRGAVQPAVEVLRRFAPEMTLAIEDASIEVEVPGLPSLSTPDLVAEGRTDRDHVELSATATGKFWTKLHVKARLDYAELAARVEIDGAGFKPQSFLDHFLAGAVVAVGLTSGDVHVEAQTDGKTGFSALVKTDIPAVLLTRAEKRVEVSGAHAEASVAVRGQQIDVTLNPVRLGTLVPLASGRLQLSTAQPRVHAALEAAALDLAGLREVTASLAGDDKFVRDYLTRIRGGQVTELRATAQAADLKGLLDAAAIDVHLKLQRAAMLAPYLEQEVTDISGALDWSQSMLSAHSVAGRLGQSRISAGSVDYSLREQRTSLALDYDVDLAQAFGIVRRLLPRARQGALDAVTATAGHAQGRFTMELKPDSWQGDIAVARSDALLRVRDAPWPVRLREGRAQVAPGRLTLADAAGAVGASSFSGVGAELVFAKPVRLASAHGSGTLAMPELYSWLRAQPGLKTQMEKVRSVAGSVDFAVDRAAGSIDRIETMQYDAILRPRRVRVELEGLPAPVSIDGGSVNVTPRALRFDAMVPALLDARAGVSGLVRDYRTSAPQVDASLANGEVGAAFMAWAWGRAEAPERLLPKTPLRFAAERVRWSQAEGLDLRASAQIDAGPALQADLAWKPGLLEVRSAHVKDRESDATLGLVTRGRLLDTRFSGVLTGRTLAALFAGEAGERPGRAEGDFRVTIDRDLRGRSTAHGRLVGERIRLDRLLGKPLLIERLELDADGQRLRVNEASLDYADQKATIRGEVRQEASGPVIDAQIDSPGIVLDALLPARSEPAPEATGLLSRAAPEALATWPLPVAGKLRVRAGFVEYQRYRIEPLAATLAVEPERARLEASEAALCGIAFPLSLDITPNGLVGSVQLRAKGQHVEATARCLTDQRVSLTGEFELRADLHTHGRRDELLSNLEGPLAFHARNGKVMKWALLGNILSFESIARLLAKGGPRMDEGGFDYRDLTMRGRVAGGRFELGEGAFDSPALGLAMKGSIGLDGRDAQLMVLVAPFGRIDWMVRRVPIVGYVVGGSLTSIPVGVRGDMRDPQIVPLSPVAVTSELAGIFERTFKLPGRLLTPLEQATKAGEGKR